jgi:hypothetical protein
MGQANTDVAGCGVGGFASSGGVGREEAGEESGAGDQAGAEANAGRNFVQGRHMLIVLRITSFYEDRKFRLTQIF